MKRLVMRGTSFLFLPAHGHDRDFVNALLAASGAIGAPVELYSFLDV